MWGGVLILGLIENWLLWKKNMEFYCIDIGVKMMSFKIFKYIKGDSIVSLKAFCTIYLLSYL